MKKTKRDTYKNKPNKIIFYLTKGLIKTAEVTCMICVLPIILFRKNKEKRK